MGRRTTAVVSASVECRERRATTDADEVELRRHPTISPATPRVTARLHVSRPHHKPAGANPAVRRSAVSLGYKELPTNPPL